MNSAEASAPGTRPTARTAAQLRLLFWLAALRTARAVREPAAEVWVPVLVPLLLVIGALWAAGASATPDLAEPQGRVALGLIVAGVAGYQAYPVLFRAPDSSFLRRLGLDPLALYARGGAELLLRIAVVVVALAIPFVSSGGDAGAALRVGGMAGLVGGGTALYALAGAALSLSDPQPRRSLAARSMGWDPQLAATAPLVFAPLAPLFAAAVAAALLGPGVSPAVPLGLAAVATGLAALGARRFTRAIPRFAPRAAEMGFAPPPAAGEAGLVADRGLSRLLPRRIAAIRARDAAVVARRFRWAASIAWPVGIGAAVALARWGAQPEVRSWVVLAGGIALLAQGAAVVGLGRIDRAGPRWVDRALGLRRAERWAGRWAFGFGLALWLTVPLALVWTFWTPVGGGLGWIGAGVAIAAVASFASVAAAGR